jgi:2-methylcitrate dehydratase
MAARQSAAPAAPSADKAYDPEIQDMASYIHQYNIDSDLAVSFSCCAMEFSSSVNYL